jgi:hypothetical protein
MRNDKTTPMQTIDADRLYRSADDTALDVRYCRSMSEQIIDTRAANALIDDVEPSLPDIPSIPGLIEFDKDEFERQLAGWKRAHGGLWVGGRANLTSSELSFHPNALNRALQTGNMDVVLPLKAVTSVEVRRAFVTNIIAISTPGFLLKIRCYKADAFADRIRAAGNQAGS